MSHDLNAVFYSHTYHPIQAGSIDGTDTAPHDHAVCRALLATSTGLYDPTGDSKAQGNPYCIVFVGRLSRDTTEATLQEVMSKYGRIKNLRLVRHIVTGASQGYAFVEYETEKEMRHAYEAAHLIKIDGHQVLVDYNRQLLMPGWIPRRLGGGLGGRKESGQLRFGGRDRPFRKPLRPIPVKELEKLGIPLPGGYMQRFETPPLPKRRSSRSATKISEDGNAHRSPKTDFRRASSQEARCREDDDQMRHVQREEKKLTHFEEEDAKRYHKRDSYKEERHQDHTWHRDYDNEPQPYERKADLEESGRPLYEEEGEHHDRRPFYRDDSGRHSKRFHQCEDEDYKRRHNDRNEKVHNRGEEDDRRRLDGRHESKDSYSRTSKHHSHEQYDNRDCYKEDSGRSQTRDRYGKKKEDRKQHYEDEEDVNESRQAKDGHSNRHKRKYRSGSERAVSDSLGSETEARSKARKLHRRDDNERLEFREPSVENRWKP